MPVPPVDFLPLGSTGDSGRVICVAIPRSFKGREAIWVAGVEKIVEVAFGGIVLDKEADFRSIPDDIRQEVNSRGIALVAITVGPDGKIVSVRQDMLKIIIP